MTKILVIDEERSVRNTLKDMLEYEGYQVSLAEGGVDGISKSENDDFDFVLCDSKCTNVNGVDILGSVHKNHPDVCVMITSREKDLNTAVDYIKRGASDFLEKPIDLNKLLSSIKNSIDKSLAINNSSEEENLTEVKTTRNNTHPRGCYTFKAEDITGNSPQIVHVKNLIQKVAPSEARVLITGANGTGKELVARALHEKSSRRNGPFIEVNCAAIPGDLIESELFGHEKGAFTSAIKQRKGKFEQADGGTIFLDEIGDMSLSAQAKVLRALQENRISRVGSDKDITVNVRVIAATNKNLFDEIQNHNFREDLYHRLSVIVVHVPTLAERAEDIPMLVKSFIEKISKEYGVKPKEITPDAIAELQKMKWTGNVRQLRNVMERLIILSENIISLEDVKLYASEV